MVAWRTTSNKSTPKRFVGENAVAGVMKPVHRKLPRFLFLGLGFRGLGFRGLGFRV